jgi:hypothetical protein
VRRSKPILRFLELTPIVFQQKQQIRAGSTINREGVRPISNS